MFHSAASSRSRSRPLSVIVTPKVRIHYLLISLSPSLSWRTICTLKSAATLGTTGRFLVALLARRPSCIKNGEVDRYQALISLTER